MHDLLGPLVLFAVAVTFTPGPNVVLVTASAANFGFRRSVPQMLGITLDFVEAALFTLVNPKAWVSALGAVAAYSTLGGDVLFETAVIAGVLGLACLISCVLWAGFGSAIGRYLVQPRRRRTFNLAMAGLLVLALVPVFW